jgi:soluble lytic murein transglycosylase-like protein
MQQSAQTRSPAFAATFVIGALVGASVAAVLIVRERGVAAANARLATAEQRNATEVAELSGENTMLDAQNRELADRVADLEFMVGHASARMKTERDEIPGYDFEQFLSRNPAARRYFPYLLDAIERYDHIWAVDPMFALAILKQESDFGRHLVSHAGALGDAQFIASTGRRYGLQAREPYTWVAGRQNFRRAAEERREARYIRNQFLVDVATELEGPPAEVRARLLKNVERHVADLHAYYQRLQSASEMQREGYAAYREYKREVNRVLAHARELEREVRARQQREDRLRRASGIQTRKSREERDFEVALVVNDYLAGVDERLSPMLLTDALVHHLADLHREFHGDRRLVASRYNASRRAMEAAVASIGGGVGIPLLDETQNYVNRVVAYHAFFAVDGGIIDNNLGITADTRFASR